MEITFKYFVVIVEEEKHDDFIDSLENFLDEKVGEGNWEFTWK